MKIETTIWRDTIRAQMEFYMRGFPKKRFDHEFDWQWFHRNQTGFLVEKVFSSMKKGLRNGNLTSLQKVRGAMEQSAEQLKSLLNSGTFNLEENFFQWFEQNVDPICSARELLADEVSKSVFDQHLILRGVSYRRFFFQRSTFESLLTVLKTEAFEVEKLPSHYLKLPLHLFTIQLHDRPNSKPLKVISTKLTLDLANQHKQYFLKRQNIDFAPRSEDVVIDCGACIGEHSTLFAGYVGTGGEVHLFEPVPLHIQFCKLQALNNPHLTGIFRINELGVGNKTSTGEYSRENVTQISPGYKNVSFPTSTLDNYLKNLSAKKVSLIKMDIEGAEVEALEGAAQSIQEFKPNLAISAYHRPEHIWEIPHKLRSLNQDYLLYFGHHSPLRWESVYYATEKNS